MSTTTANFDEVIVSRPDGTTARLTPAEFFKLPLTERVQLLCNMKLRFLKAGRMMPSSEALK